MADPSTRRVVLMSVHPEYADALLDGTKTVELRKSRVASDISHIVIYATAPVQRVLGWVRAVKVEHGRPTEIWKTHKSRVGIRGRAFRAYYRGHDHATAIHIDSPQRLSTPLALSALEEQLTAPQSWRYLSAAAARNVGIPV